MAQELVFSEPCPGRLPWHLADLDAVGLTSAMAELSLLAFRAKQLVPRKYYGRLLAGSVPDPISRRPFAIRLPTLCSRHCSLRWPQ